MYVLLHLEEAIVSIFVSNSTIIDAEMTATNIQS